MKIKHIVFRADSSSKIGWGHILRCSALAQRFKEKNYKVSFIVRPHLNNISHILNKNGFNIFYLKDKKYCWKEDAIQTKNIIKNIGQIDWLIMDNYGLDAKWENVVRPFVKKLMVIDDMTLRTHECDLLLDQNYYKNTNKLYSKFIPKESKILLGPKFALIRNNFYEKRKKLKLRSGEINRILISFGGSDNIHEILKVMNAITELDKKIEVDLLLPNLNQNYTEIQKLLSKFTNITIHYQNLDIVKLMINADLSIGAGGSSNWERCCLGLPSVVSIFAKNQLQLTTELAEKGCIVNLGMSKKLSSKNYVNTIKNLDKFSLNKMSKNGLKLVDGKGTIRVVKEMLNFP